jgi:hypothetical protein
MEHSLWIFGAYVKNLDKGYSPNPLKTESNWKILKSRISEDPVFWGAESRGPNSHRNRIWRHSFVRRSNRSDWFVSQSTRGQVEAGVAPIDRQGRRTAVRHLTVMVSIRPGNRQPDAASCVEAPGGREQHEDDFF